MTNAVCVLQVFFSAANQCVALEQEKNSILQILRAFVCCAHMYRICKLGNSKLMLAMGQKPQDFQRHMVSESKLMIGKSSSTWLQTLHVHRHSFKCL